jgi:antitoxin component YwqK of YwqJK toxin-antitoxin module
VLSNTNLFTRAEQKLMAEIREKFKNVTTNTAPAGTRLTGTNKSYVFLDPQDSTLRHYQYENSGDYVEILFTDYDGKGEKAKVAFFVAKNGDGYEMLFDGTFRQFKNGQLDGLWIDCEDGHCAALMRFVNGKAVGKWLMWNRGGDEYMEADFEKPFDYFGHLSIHP